MRLRSFQTQVLLIAGYLVLAIVMTWPTVTHMSTRLPGGAGDPLLTTWYLGHDINRYLALDFKGFFDGNIFYPSRLTLACSEHFISTALLGVPFFLFSGGDIVFVNNALIILSFMLTAWGMHLFVRRLTGDHAAAVLGAVIFTFPPFKTGQVEHLHMLTTQWIPFVFLFLHRFMDTRSYKDALGLALFFVLNALATIFYMIVVTLGVLVFAVAMLPRVIKYWREMLGPVAVSAVIVILLLAPVLKPYVVLSDQLSFKRGVSVNMIGSATPRSFLATPSWQGKNLFYGRVLNFDRFDKGGGVLFPGVVAVACAAWFSFMAARRRFPWTMEYTAYAAIFFCALLLSFGPVIRIGRGVENPVFSLFFNFFPGAQSMRVPSRFGILMMFGLSVLAGYGVRNMMPTASAARRSLLFILPVACMLEYLSIPIMLEPVPDLRKPPEIYSWLKSIPGDVAVLELPSNNFWHNARYVYYSQFHWKKIVNGYSSYSPPFFDSFYAPPALILEKESLEALRRVGVSYLLVHPDLMKEGEYTGFIKAVNAGPPDCLRKVAEFGRDTVYELTGHRGMYSPPASLGDTDDRVQFLVPSTVPGGALCRGVVQLTGPVPEHITGTLTVPMNRYIDLKFANKVDGKVETFGARLSDSPLKGEKSYPFQFKAPHEAGVYAVSLVSGGRIVAGCCLTVKSDLLTTRRPGKLLAEVVPAHTVIAASVSKPVVLKLSVTNNGNTLWLAGSEEKQAQDFEVKVVGVIFLDGREIKRCSAHLARDLSPGESLEIELRFKAPSTPGRYKVTLDLVNGSVSWSERGSVTAVTVDLVVSPLSGVAESRTAAEPRL